jgi:hypothetical protein
MAGCTGSRHFIEPILHIAIYPYKTNSISTMDAGHRGRKENFYKNFPSLLHKRYPQ